MYADLFFLLLVFLLPSLVVDSDNYLIESSTDALLYGIVICLLTLSLVVILATIARVMKQKTKNHSLFVSNILLILALVCFFLIFGAQRSLLINLPFQTVSAIIAISFYLVGLWVFHFTSTKLKVYPAGRQATRQIRLLTPFIVPFLLLSTLVDIVLWFPSYLVPKIIKINESFAQTTLLAGLSGLFFLALLLFFPYLIQKIWQCKPLQETDSSLAKRLQLICERAQFKQSGIKTWTIMNDSLTAGIIGILPRCRYVIFSKKLLHILSPEAIEAVLAHEIGHNHRKHLLLYPFIIVGMALLLSAFQLEKRDISPLFTFSIYTAVIMIYLRLVLGFFSRIFERQADLHVYELAIPPEAMIEALEDVSAASGNIHKMPNWHHYSIQERIDFLKQTMLKPQLIEQHHAYVKKCFGIYLIFLALLSIIAFYTSW